MENRQQALQELGFRFGINGPHAARTIMLDDLRVLLTHVPESAARGEYAHAVLEQNLLGKPTKKARELALRHLAALYGLDPDNPIFRTMRRLWGVEPAQPVLALSVALARDPLLRGSKDFFLEKAIGAAVPRDEVEAFLNLQCPGRFSAASLKSFAQNVGGSWTAAGYLSGRVRKHRASPAIYPENVALCLFLAHLEGDTGQGLFSSHWVKLLEITLAELEGLTSSASHKGHLVFMNAGGVKEVRFPDYLTKEEERIRQEASHVV